MNDINFSARCLCLDLEVHPKRGHILKIGAIREDTGKTLSRKGKFDLGQALAQLDAMARGAGYLLGHNIIAHDARLLRALRPDMALLELPVIDTLLLSPLAFPKNPYHRLLKDYKIIRDSVSDPVADARLTLELFREELDAFRNPDVHSPAEVACFHYLLANEPGGQGAMLDRLMGEVRGEPRPTLAQTSQHMISLLMDITCMTRLRLLLDQELRQPGWRWPLAYVLAWAQVAGGNSVLPLWVRKNFPQASQLIHELRDVPCQDPACRYCQATHDPRRHLRDHFGFEAFRALPANAAGGSLQEDIVRAGMSDEHLLAILPTGGGKSICYQLPAVARYRRNGSLTVIISPLQSLMKDQVDNLIKQGILPVAALNGLLTHVPERKDVLERLRLGDIGILLVAPEQLRSPSFKDAVRHREVGAWVFDEAHCLSKWGHDFRTDYLYVARFIKEFHKPETIRAGGAPAYPPISCFTATAKQDVVDDLRRHFRNELGIEMRLFEGGHERANLTWLVVPSTPAAKHAHLHELLKTWLPAEGGCIIYAAKRKGTEEIAEYLQLRGEPCAYFHAGLQPERKKQVQQDFLAETVRTIAATSAFGMGVDAPRTRVVLHAEMPGSLESYLQEAGRAGRDQQPATCILLYNEEDAETQFKMLARSMLTRRMIAQILRAVRRRAAASQDGAIVMTTGEILAVEDIMTGIDPGSHDADTKVRVALACLEKGGFLERNENHTRVFPGCLRVPTLEAAVRRIAQAGLSEERQAQYVQIVSQLINADPDQGINTDELMTSTGLPGSEIIRVLHQLESLGILENQLTLTAFLRKGGMSSSEERLRRVEMVEAALIGALREAAPDAADGAWQGLNLPQLTQRLKDLTGGDVMPDKVLKILMSIARDAGADSQSRGSLDLVQVSRDNYKVRLNRTWPAIEETSARRRATARCLLGCLLLKLPGIEQGTDLLVKATLGELNRTIAADAQLAAVLTDPDTALERALMYLHEQEVLILNRGLSVFRSAMSIQVNRSEKRRFEDADFESLAQHYKERIFQIHVMHEYARLGLSDMQDALRLVEAYFDWPRAQFLDHYFSDRRDILELATTQESWRRIVEDLNNPVQAQLVADTRDVNRLVLAGPGAGKTRVIVHRVAYLLRVKRVLPQAILVLTYNRHAASEIRRRLRALVGDDARGVSVLTYHALAMRLTGTSLAARTDDSVPDFGKMLQDAIDLLAGKTQIDLGKDELRDRLLGGFQYILIDEYQDIDRQQYELISAVAGRQLADPDQKLTILAVGDDDQNVYSFRETNNAFIQRFTQDYGADTVYLTENYRSSQRIVSAANVVIDGNPHRMKAAHPVRVDRARRDAPQGGEWEALDAAVGRGRVQVHHVPPHPFEQARCAMEELQRLRGLAPDWDWSKCAVLAREHKYLEPVRAWCELNDIPCHSQSDQGKRPPFHQVREVAQYLDALRSWPAPLITGAELLSLRERLCASASDNAWAQALHDCIEDYERQTQEEAMAVAGVIDWIYGYGADWSRAGGQGVALLTAHAAKGMEFDHVVLLDGGWTGPQDREAERRLYYVAMTRAKRTLSLCHFSGRAHPFVRPLRGAPDVHERDYPARRAVDPALGRKYVALALGDVDIGYAGRYAAAHPVHAAIARLQPGARLGWRLGERLEFIDDDGVTVGRTSKGYQDEGRPVKEVRVTAVVNRRREQIDDASWRECCQVPVWSAVLCEIVYGPADQEDPAGGEARAAAHPLPVA